MEIGTEEPAITVEPVEDPFHGEAPPERTPEPEPERVREPEKVPA
jgi:hypothetical protein